MECHAPASSLSESTLPLPIHPFDAIERFPLRRYELHVCRKTKDQNRWALHVLNHFEHIFYRSFQIVLSKDSSEYEDSSSVSHPSRCVKLRILKYWPVPMYRPNNFKSIRALIIFSNRVGIGNILVTTLRISCTVNNARERVIMKLQRQELCNN